MVQIEEVHSDDSDADQPPTAVGRPGQPSFNPADAYTAGQPDPSTSQGARKAGERKGSSAGWCCGARHTDS
jgi:hypothetical protein